MLELPTKMAIGCGYHLGTVQAQGTSWRRFKTSRCSSSSLSTCGARPCRNHQPNGGFIKHICRYNKQNIHNMYIFCIILLLCCNFFIYNVYIYVLESTQQGKPIIIYSHDVCSWTARNSHALLLKLMRSVGSLTSPWGEEICSSGITELPAFHALGM